MEPRRTVSVWCYVAGPPARVLVLLRPPHRAPGWQPVTGRVEPGDATLENAAAREVVEESGLPPPRAVEDLGHEHEFHGLDGTAYRQRAFAARYDAPLPLRISDEHEDGRWASVAEALALLRWDDDKATLGRLAARHGLK